MTSSRWPLVKQILQSALAKDSKARQAFVAEACGDDLELRHEVEQHLRYEAVAESALPATRWLDVPAEPAVPAPDEFERAGPYRILKKIGEGRTSVVFLAERDDGEHSQRVAVKVIKAAPQTTEPLNLFRKERQILARLQHPNIARLLDGGTTGGRLYYVMEYVEGVPVTDYCAEKRLDLRRRLQLFCVICAAVGYAHRHLILHRDLKPGNILVTVDGVPKLLDFGLAKVLQEQSPDPSAEVTVEMMTPGYASPEQVLQRPLSTATDVYSLGVLLYRLITGRSPYHTRDSSPLETLQAICETEPAAPSRAVREGSRAEEGGGAAPRAAEIRGDLDNIVLRALQKEPERRYPAVEELREDLECFLAGLPVRASRNTADYRLVKCVKRHRLRTAALILGSAGALAAAGGIWWESRHSEMRFNQVRQLAHAVVFELHDAIEDLPGSTAARKLLVERSLEYLNNLEATGGANRELLWEMADAHRKIGDVLGNPARSNLGDIEGAIRQYARARELYGELHRLAPDDAQAMRGLGDVAGSLADVYDSRRDVKAALEARREAAVWLSEAARRDPGPNAKKSAALAQWNLAAAFNQTADWPAAIDAWTNVLKSYEEIARVEPGGSGAQRNVALANQRLGAVCAMAGQYDLALERYSAALKIHLDQLAADPGGADAAMAASFDYSDIGWVHGKAGRHGEAAENFERALSMREKLAAADPNDYRAGIGIARVLMRVAVPYVRLGDIARAGAAQRRAVRAFEKALARNPADQQTRLDYVRGLMMLADASLSAATPPGGAARALAAECFRRATDAALQLKPGALTQEEQQVIAGFKARLAR